MRVVAASTGRARRHPAGGGGRGAAVVPKGPPMSASPLPMAAGPRRRAVDVSLWVAQVLIAGSFCAAGAMKVGMPIGRLSHIWPWTGALPVPSVRLLGVVDLAGGAGVLLPAVARTVPGLTVWSALGCVVLQACAIAFHTSRGEVAVVPGNVVFVVLSAFIGWGRWRWVPIPPRRPAAGATRGP